MKTTLDIADNILIRAKKLARHRHRTLKSLTEEGLSLVLDKIEKEKEVKIQAITFAGSGLTKEFTESNWSDIRSASYEGRGG